MSRHRPVVLMVDDYDINLDILEAYLMDAHPDLDIIRASTGLEAMQVFNKQELDLVLLDVMLPDIKGFELCRMMKEIRKENILPIIMITALNDRESMIEGLSNGADDFLTKPVNSDELSIRVRNLLLMRQMAMDLNHRYRELSQDLHLARELLNDFLPKKKPDTKDVYTEVIYEPSSIIGGDFYDFLFIDDTHYGFFIADVKGHGASAAMIVALLKEQLYELHADWLAPDVLFGKLNQTICRFFSGTRSDYFITAVYVVFNKEEKTVRWVNAGHNPPAYFCSGEAVTLSEPTGLPFGILENTDYQIGRMDVRRFATLLLYTDGLFELPLFYQKQRYFTSVEELLTFFASAGIVPTASMIFSEVRASLRQFEQHDDVNVISLKF